MDYVRFRIFALGAQDSPPWEVPLSIPLIATFENWQPRQPEESVTVTPVLDSRYPGSAPLIDRVVLSERIRISGYIEASKRLSMEWCRGRTLRFEDPDGVHIVYFNRVERGSPAHPGVYENYSLEMVVM